jgi:hypothetical protein
MFLIINTGVSYVHVGIIIESKDVILFKTKFPIKNAPRTSSRELIHLGFLLKMHLQLIPLSILF